MGRDDGLNGLGKEGYIGRFYDGMRDDMAFRMDVYMVALFDDGEGLGWGGLVTVIIPVHRSYGSWTQFNVTKCVGVRERGREGTSPWNTYSLIPSTLNLT